MWESSRVLLCGTLSGDVTLAREAGSGGEDGGSVCCGRGEKETMSSSEFEVMRGAERVVRGGEAAAALVGMSFVVPAVLCFFAVAGGASGALVVSGRFRRWFVDFGFSARGALVGRVADFEGEGGSVGLEDLKPRAAGLLTAEPEPLLSSLRGV